MTLRGGDPEPLVPELLGPEPPGTPHPAVQLPYETASAFRAALKARFTEIARTDHRYTFDELQRQFAYDRLLGRCFAAADAESWVLKGAGALLARLPGARHSKDVDLYYRQQGDLPEAAVDALCAVLDIDLGDHFRFEVTKVSPLQEGVLGSRVHLTAYLGAPHSFFHVDVVVGTTMTGMPEIVPPLTPLVVKGLVRPPYRAFPLPDHCADKLCAIVETHRQAGVARVSTRVKDLVDLAIIASTQTVDAASLRTAILAGTAHRCIPMPSSFAVPDWVAWRAGYPRTARSAPVAVPSFGDAVELVGRFLDPVLAGQITGRWDPVAARWREQLHPAASVPGTPDAAGTPDTPYTPGAPDTAAAAGTPDTPDTAATAGTPGRSRYARRTQPGRSVVRLAGRAGVGRRDG